MGKIIEARYIAHRLIEAFLEENEIEVCEDLARLEPDGLLQFIEGEVIAAITHR